MISKIQEEHKLWQLRNFGKLPPEDSLLGIVEEVGELAHAFIKAKQRVRLHEDLEAKAKDAIGDIAIFLMSFCSAHDWDFELIVYRTWKEVKSRDWVKYPDTGRPT